MTKGRAFLLAVPVLFLSCRTVHFDKASEAGAETRPGSNLAGETELNEAEDRRFAVEELVKEVDIESTVIYIDRPVYSPEEPDAAGEEPVTGSQAVIQSNSSSVQVPQQYINGLMYYAFDETFEYEIHAQPYRTTDLMLEPGETVIEMPFLSEETVWEIAAGVSREYGQDVQHFFIKPAHSRLTTSMIIITDRRVYHLLLKSFSDHYMAMVRWRYPPSAPNNLQRGSMRQLERRMAQAQAREEVYTVNPELLSFDYRMSYSVFKRPLWLPARVYDDGSKTYIQLDERVLHSESPVIFNRRNQRINYRVHGNLIVIDHLIERITIRLGGERVSIVKKRYRGGAEEREGEGGE
jgi:type IV secretion system protein VirB9